MSVWQTVGLVVSLVVILVISSLGNGMVLLYNSFFKEKSQIRPLEIFVLHSALVDFLASVTYIPLWVRYYYGKVNAPLKRQFYFEAMSV